MLIETLKQLFTRDLYRLKAEIELYQNEAILWQIEKEIKNSAGNLCLHLIGNLNSFIGATLGNTGYVRNRPLEFSSKNIPKAELIRQIEATIKAVDQSLDQVTEAQLAADFPIVVFEKPTSTEYFLVHLSTHLAYHLGQINYHRRLLHESH